jgi:hypothetical protein
VLFIFEPEILDGLAGESEDDRKGEKSLGRYHRLGRVKETQETQRAGTGEHQVNEETRKYRRKAHKRVEQDEKRPSAREAVKRQGRAQGQGEKGGGQNSEHRHFERAADDLPENGIAARQKTDSI